MADAKVVQRHIARYSEDPDFLNDFQEIADDLVRAEVTAAERQWSLAAECYVRIVQRGTAIKDAVARREADAKEKARREAEERSRREAAEKVRRTASPKTGDVKVVVLGVDPVKKRISLSIKQAGKASAEKNANAKA